MAIVQLRHGDDSGSHGYALTPSTRLTFDYQLIDNPGPGYDADCGPVNIFAARVHWQF